MKTIRLDKDAFGQGLVAYLRDGWAYEIVERNDGNVDVTDKGVYFTKYKEWRDIEKTAVKYANGKIADIGCGAGRHSLYLQSKGFDVTGVDSSPLAIEVCRKLGLKKAINKSLTEMVNGKIKFDTLLMLGHNFGLFESKTKAKRIFQKLYKIMPDKSRIIAETMDPYKTDNPAHMAYQRNNVRMGRMAGQIRIRVRFRNITGPWFDYIFVSLKELKDIISVTGWKIEKVLKDKSPTYIAIIIKGGK